MISPILDLQPHMTAKKMRACFEAYDDWAREQAKGKLAALDKTDVEALGPKIKEIVEEASARIADAAAELSEGMRLRNELRGQGGFR